MQKACKILALKRLYPPPTVTYHDITTLIQIYSKSVHRKSSRISHLAASAFQYSHPNYSLDELAFTKKTSRPSEAMELFLGMWDDPLSNAVERCKKTTQLRHECLELIEWCGERPYVGGDRANTAFVGEYLSTLGRGAFIPQASEHQIAMNNVARLGWR